VGQFIDSIAFEEALDRIAKLEEILDNLTRDIAQSTDLAEINVAAGIAHDALHGIS
jgi:hypothetical protein